MKSLNKSFCKLCGLCLLVLNFAAMLAQTPLKNVVTANPDVPRPETTPVVVELFADQQFGSSGDNARMDAVPGFFKYTPPTGGPWAKIVLEAYFSVEPGFQYDRSYSIWLDHTNLAFGSTQEPVPDEGPDWKIARDVTDYYSLLKKAGEGKIWLNNWTDKVRSSVIKVSAKLLFYPAKTAFPAPITPDEILSLNGQENSPANLAKATDLLTRTLTFPRNTTEVYLDLIAQPQSKDEFYYTKKDGYRLAFVEVDGKKAGLAPITPWIFTGGMDPFLWEPTPGAETLNFMPYRMDLSPLAGLLSDGKPHQISVGVLHADDFFSIAASLLVFVDQNKTQTGGKITRNTLAAEKLEPADDASNQLTTALHHYVIEGFVNTSEGKIVHKVESATDFQLIQQGKGEDQSLNHQVQNTVVSTSLKDGESIKQLKTITTFDLQVQTRPAQQLADKRIQEAHKIRQEFKRFVLLTQKGLPPFYSTVQDIHLGADNANYFAGDRQSFKPDHQSSLQLFNYDNSLGDCYQMGVRASDTAVTSVNSGTGCLNGKNTLHWFVHPDGSPDSFGWREVQR